MKEIFVFFKKYFRNNKNSMKLYIFLMLISSVLSIFIPYISGKFIDMLISIRNYNFLLIYSLIFIVISFCNIIIGFICNRIYVKLQIDTGYELNKDIIRHVQNLSISFCELQDTSYLNQRINNDSNTISMFCIQLIPNIITNLIILIIPIILLLSFDPYISISMMIIATIYLVVYNTIKKPLYDKGYKFKQIQSQFFSKLNEQLFNIKFIKINAINDKFIERLDNIVKKLIDIALNYQSISYIYSGIDSIIDTTAQITIFIVGGISVINNRITIGEFTILSSYFNMVIKSVRYFFNLGKNIQDTKVSLNRVIDILKLDEETNGDIKLNSIDKIQIQNLNFSYSDKDIILNFNYIFEKGNIYSIIGDNGSGKSTLLNILLGCYIDELSGIVLYNSIPIKQLDMKHIRNKLVGVTEQNPVIISDTIKYNILLTEEKNIEYSNIKKLISILKLENYINGLQDGIETVINEKADNISGGEKQKLSILRTLLKNPDLLILDEPTSALDKDSKYSLKEYLKSIKNDKIIILVTHDKTFSDISNYEIIL